MKVKLLSYTHISVLIEAIRICYDSLDKSDSYYYCDKDLKNYNKSEFQIGTRDKGLIESIIKNGHTSTLEHINFTFKIEGISRFVLQELTRHRIASYSVKSTRYTLGELRKENSFFEKGKFDLERAEKYINLSGLMEIDKISLQSLENLRYLIKNSEYPNDRLKYALPESYKCNLIMTINARSLLNFFNLRLSERAHFEIRNLATEILNNIPNIYDVIFDRNLPF